MKKYLEVKNPTKEVNRKSDKAYTDAINAAGDVIEKLIDYVCKENKIEVLNA